MPSNIVMNTNQHNLLQYIFISHFQIFFSQFFFHFLFIYLFRCRGHWEEVLLSSWGNKLSIWGRRGLKGSFKSEKGEIEKKSKIKKYRCRIFFSKEMQTVDVDPKIYIKMHFFQEKKKIQFLFKWQQNLTF